MEKRGRLPRNKGRATHLKSHWNVVLKHDSILNLTKVYMEDSRKDQDGQEIGWICGLDF